MLESSDVITDPENTFDLSGVPLSELLKSGDVIVGETLEELCGKVGWDYATVQDEIDRYNANVAANAVTDEYGRALFSIQMENGPWYAIPRTPSVHHTMGGVVINTEAQVLNEAGEIIPGLYAAGELINGKYFNQVYVSGDAQLLCTDSGILAGGAAAVYALGE